MKTMADTSCSSTWACWARGESHGASTASAGLCCRDLACHHARCIALRVPPIPRAAAPYRPCPPSAPHLRLRRLKVGTERLHRLRQHAVLGALPRCHRSDVALDDAAQLRQPAAAQGEGGGSKGAGAGWGQRRLPGRSPAATSAAPCSGLPLVGLRAHHPHTPPPLAIRSRTRSACPPTIGWPAPFCGTPKSAPRPAVWG